MAASVVNLFSLTLLIMAFGHARYNESWTDDRETVPRNCLDIQRQGSNKSGIYKVYPFHNNHQYHIQVYCDMKTSGGGWTVIQRRDDIQPRENFNRSWSDYVSGFGDLLGEFWLGLKYMHALTVPIHMNLRFDLADFEGNFHHAEYSSFIVNSNYSYYRMTLSGFTGGNAGDSFTYHNKTDFSTKDEDHDSMAGSCSEKFGGGWWYKACFMCNPNGLYLSGETDNEKGVTWATWRGFSYSLKFVEMKVRPVEEEEEPETVSYS